MVVDTNVAVVADEKALHADATCVAICLQELVITQKERRVLLDDNGLILGEYLAQKPHGFPRGAGDAFLVWVYDNQANPAYVARVRVTPLAGDAKGFAEFPDDLDLAGFDPSDRKFVAVAIANGDSPTILNAVDTDWWIHRRALERNHVRVKFVCPGLMVDKD